MINEENFNIDFINHNNLIEYARLFSEDDELLEKVLLNLWNNNIKTVSCCKGHDYNDYFYVPYISFSIDDNNIDYINRIMNSNILSKKGVSYSIQYNISNNYGVFSIYMRNGTRDEILNSINYNKLMIGEKMKFNKLIEYSINIIEYAKKNGYEFELENDNDKMYLMINKVNERLHIIENPLPLDSAINISNKFPVGYFNCNVESLKKLNDLLLKL